MPDKEQQAEIERIGREGKANAAAIKKAGDARIAQLKARIDAYSADVAQREAAFREQAAHMPKQLDSVTDMSFSPDGRVNVGQIRFIHQYDDGHGNTVYTVSSRGNSGLAIDQIHIVAQRIQTQQSAFGGLPMDKQAIIRREFDSGNAASANPYGDFLQNEASRKKV